MRKKFILKKKKEVEVPIREVPTINYKYQVPVRYQYSPDNRPEIIQAAYAEVGNKYVSCDYNNVLELISKDTNDSGDIRAWKLVFKAYSNLGDIIEVKTNGLYTIVNDPKAVEEVMEKYIQGVNSMAEKMGSKVKTSIDKATGKVVKKGGAKKSNVAMDPKTGCRPGTTAQIVGEIMLKNKPSADHRQKSIEQIFAVLKDQGFDDKKAKSLAASWYSTLVLRKPEIYGKFKVAKAAPTAKKSTAPAAKKGEAKKLKIKKA